MTCFGEEPPPFRRFVCITDSITVNAIWHRCTCDAFLVPNDATAAVLATAGVPDEKVRVTGFPVNPRFAQLGPLRQPPSDEYGRRVLYMVNARGLITPEIIRGLAEIPGTRLTVTIGRDEHLRRTAEEIRKTTGRKFEIVGWSDQLPRLMLESHLLISKAGGATVQETIAAGCPMIVNQIVPGQEAGNAQLLRETGSGVDRDHAARDRRRRSLARSPTTRGNGGNGRKISAASAGRAPRSRSRKCS